MAKKTKSTVRKTARKKTSKKAQPVDSDSNFLFKAVIFLILGSQWVYIDNPPEWQIPIPVGLIIGLVFATHEHFQIDRKIEYVILIFAAFISFWLPIGFVISV